MRKISHKTITGNPYFCAHFLKKRTGPIVKCPPGSRPARMTLSGWQQDGDGIEV